MSSKSKNAFKQKYIDVRIEDYDGYAVNRTLSNPNFSRASIVTTV
ncbi:MAG: hypothetical protein AB4040_16710 [Synechococcus sp.]